MHPHMYEMEHVKAVIKQNHLDAWRDEQIRLSRVNHAMGVAMITRRLRAGIAARITLVGERFRHRPITTTEPGGSVQSLIHSADNTVIG